MTLLPIDPYLQSQINKRMTLNLLIQGAAWHTSLTAHHLVRTQLELLEPQATRMYDRFAAGVYMSYWNSELSVVVGLSSSFWSRVGHADNPFCRHPLLVKHGRQLAQTSKKNIIRRCRKKGVCGIPGILTIQLTGILMKVKMFEEQYADVLVELAKTVTSEIWSIDRDRLRASLTEEIEFGDIREPRTFTGRVLRNLMVAWGGVAQDADGQLYVVGRSKFWNLLIHELTKGTVELICLHGLAELQDDEFETVMQEADQIEFEVWMMQAGADLYRRLLQVLPRRGKLPECLMRIALLSPAALEQLMLAVIERPSYAAKIVESSICND